MRTLNQKPLYIILHIHKCAGLSITSAINSGYKKGEYLALYKHQNKYFENRAFIKSYLKSLSINEIDKLKVITGHGAFYGIHKLINRTCRYVVFLRNPLTRTISNYAYFLENTITGKKIRRSVLNPKGDFYDFNSWFTKNTIMHDYMTRYLYKNFYYNNPKGKLSSRHLKRVIETLESFDQVGVVERKHDMLHLFSNLGLTLMQNRVNATPSVYKSIKYNKMKINKQLTIDWQLYEYFNHHPQPQIATVEKMVLNIKRTGDYIKYKSKIKSL